MGTQDGTWWMPRHERELMRKFTGREASTMQFESAEHERSYRLACKAVAHARREAYATARAMSTGALQRCEPAYRAATGITGPVTGEALTQLRMVRTVVAMRARAGRTR